MSILSAFKYLIHHKPSPTQLQAVEDIACAAQKFIDELKAKVPEVQGKAEAIQAVEAAAAHANAAFTTAHAQDATAQVAQPAQPE